MLDARWATALSAALATPLHAQSPTSFAAATWDGSSQGRAIISADVIVGAVLMLVMIMLLSAFALEATACGFGVPNCD